MSDNEELKRMVMTFRVSELSALLAYANKNKIGRKQELQARALVLTRSRIPAIQMKIRELYQAIQSQTNMPSLSSMSAGVSGVERGVSFSTLNYPAHAAPLHQQTRSTYSQQQQQYDKPVDYGKTAMSAGAAAAAAAASAAASAAANKLPTHPDLQFKRLPFFDIIGELIKPTCLAPSQAVGKGFNDLHFTFHLSPQQADQIASNYDSSLGAKVEFPVQIQARFCIMETTCAQEDHFPPNISMRVNNKTFPLPNPIPSNKQGVEPRRPPRPVNITSFCRISPVVGNSVYVSWATELGRAYCVTLCLVRRLASQDLLGRLRARGVKNADFTRALIKEKLTVGADDEIATTSLRCSLQCPLGKCRMTLPCRATTCTHLQCFDAGLFINMNERKSTWTCPVCDKPALYDNLIIDGYFTEMLSSTSASTMDVRLEQDGSWTDMNKTGSSAAGGGSGGSGGRSTFSDNADVSIETLEDDSDEIKVTGERVVTIEGCTLRVSSTASPPPTTATPAAGASSGVAAPECIDLISDDEDDDASSCHATSASTNSGGVERRKEPAPAARKRPSDDTTAERTEAAAAAAAAGNWMATPVGDTRLKLSFSSSSLANTTAVSGSSTNVPVVSSSSSSRDAPSSLQSISAVLAGLTAGAAAPAAAVVSSGALFTAGQPTAASVSSGQSSAGVAFSTSMPFLNLMAPAAGGDAAAAGSQLFAAGNAVPGMWPSGLLSSSGALSCSSSGPLSCSSTAVNTAPSAASSVSAALHDLFSTRTSSLAAAAAAGGIQQPPLFSTVHHTPLNHHQQQQQQQPQPQPSHSPDVISLD